jgi:hypothetical protein
MKFKLLVILLAIGMAGTARANLVTNGTFEDASLGNGWSINGTVGVAPVSAYQSCCGISGLSYPYGHNAAFFGWGNLVGGSLSQSISTVAGQSYALSFLYGAIAGNRLQTGPFAGNGPQVMNVLVSNGNSVLVSQNFNAHGTYDQTQFVSPFSVQFTATSSLTRLSFNDVSVVTNSVDGMLDNVSVAAVPEAETYAMFLAGLGLMGFVARRRKTKQLPI